MRVRVDFTLSMARSQLLLLDAALLGLGDQVQGGPWPADLPRSSERDRSVREGLVDNLLRRRALKVVRGVEDQVTHPRMRHVRF